MSDIHSDVCSGGIDEAQICGRDILGEEEEGFCN